MRLPHYEAATPPAGTVFRVEETGLGEAFTSAARRLRHVTHEALSPFGITPGQSRALGVLHRHGTMRLADLSGHLRITPRSTTEVVDALESRGLVERSPDPGDRRATLVTLTAEGSRTADAVRAARAEEAQTFFGRLSDTDRTELNRILRALREDP
jgi:DNA-binding MarR family transcriptional regulator